jgi:hypothetical protein
MEAIANFVYRVGARYYRALIAVLRIAKTLFVPDIFTTGFAGLFFYLRLRIFEDGMVAEAITF